jgi:hypothetical protein
MVWTVLINPSVSLLQAIAPRFRKVHQNLDHQSKTKDFQAIKRDSPTFAVKLPSVETIRILIILSSVNCAAIATPAPY